MKEVFTLIVLIVTPTMAFAQGTISINNTASELVQQWTAVGNSTLISVLTGQGHVQFLAAPAGTSLIPFTIVTAGGLALNFLTLEGFLAANPGWNAYAITATVAPGRFVGSTVTVSPLAPGGSIEYFTIGWTGTCATWDQAVTSWGSMLGVSPMLTSTTGNPTTPIPGTPTPMNGTYTGIVLAPLVPEPATFALAGLGLAALLVFRRRS
jgi:hypothetical protein